MPLSRDTIKSYRNIGHDLKPVVTISENGLSEGVQNELDRALTDHELVKVKLAIGDREARKTICAEAASKAGAEIVQEIGKVALMYRESNKSNIKTSNIR
ncbi:YhbY family RNA-binding protein [Agaribacterium sp. ZY112]|uniref:YhbY family RNA-binding protein n=1 Tax=Agaribacterium sp. ZY112 TaxID=3233574 RepID=UPI0035249DD4